MAAATTITDVAATAVLTPAAITKAAPLSMKRAPTPPKRTATRARFVITAIVPRRTIRVLKRPPKSMIENSALSDAVEWISVVRIGAWTRNAATQVAEDQIAATLRPSRRIAIQNRTQAVYQRRQTARIPMRLAAPQREVAPIKTVLVKDRTKVKTKALIKTIAKEPVSRLEPR
jgi:hypothetical protein